MNAFDMARTAYRPTNAPTRTPSSIEYEAFVRVTRRLKSAVANDDVSVRELYEALGENRRLWMLVAESVADSANALPADLRARLFYLAEFTAQHTSKVFRREADPAVLIELNAAIMRGLRAQSDRP